MNLPLLLSKFVYKSVKNQSKFGQILTFVDGIFWTKKNWTYILTAFSTNFLTDFLKNYLDRFFERFFAILFKNFPTDFFKQIHWRIFWKIYRQICWRILTITRAKCPKKISISFLPKMRSLITSTKFEYLPKLLGFCCIKSKISLSGESL